MVNDDMAKEVEHLRKLILECLANQQRLEMGLERVLSANREMMKTNDDLKDALIHEFKKS